jgi:hypothetical protein
MTSDHHTWISLVNSKGSTVNTVCVGVGVCVRQWKRESTYTQNMSQASDGKPEGWLVQNSSNIQNKQKFHLPNIVTGGDSESLSMILRQNTRKSSRSQKFSTRSCWMVLIYLLIHFINLLVYPFTCLFVGFLISLFISLIHSFTHLQLVQGAPKLFPTGQKKYYVFGTEVCEHLADAILWKRLLKWRTS